MRGAEKLFRLHDSQSQGDGRMSIFKRGRIYWYKFMWNGEAIRESTRQTNKVLARNIESAHRTSLAKGEVGIREKKTVPTLSDFCGKRLAGCQRRRIPSAHLWIVHVSGLPHTKLQRH